MFPGDETAWYKVVSQACGGGWLGGDAIVIKCLLCLWLLLVSRGDGVYPHTHGLLERTRE